MLLFSALLAAAACGTSLPEHPAVLTLNGEPVPNTFASSAPSLVLALSVPSSGARDAAAAPLADLELHLERNDRLYGANYHELELNALTNEISVRQAGPPAVSCMYIGTVHQDGRRVEGSVVGLSLCNGAEGEFSMGGTVWRLQPERAMPVAQDGRRLEVPAYRVAATPEPEARRMGSEAGSTCGVVDGDDHGHAHAIVGSNSGSSKSVDHSDARRRAPCPNGTPKHAEIFIVNDHARWMALGNTAADRTVAILNFASASYAATNFTECVDLVLVGQLTLTQANPPGLVRHCNEVDPVRPSLGPGCWTGCVGATAVNCTLKSSAPAETDYGVTLSTFRDWMNGLRTRLRVAYGTAYDAAHWFSHERFIYPVIGLAYVNTVCSGSAYGINSARSDSDASNANLFSHELGHNFAMGHTDTGIMGSGGNWFNNVSVSQTNAALASFTCLSLNVTTPSVPPVCGNGILENGEQCDSGFLNDTCCDISTCRLAPGCQCANTDPCCRNGAFLRAGTVCRAAQGTCDLAETCTGSSSLCPDDIFKLPNVTCRDSIGMNGTCVKGACVPSRLQQCRSNNAVASDRCQSFDCAALHCGSQNSTWCNYYWSYGALDGSPCDAANTMFCYQGACVNISTFAPATWEVSPWSACIREPSASPCGRGWRNRTAECKSWGSVVPVAQCGASQKPQTMLECFDFSCTHTQTPTASQSESPKRCPLVNGAVVCSQYVPNEVRVTIERSDVVVSAGATVQLVVGARSAVSVPAMAASSHLTLVYAYDIRFAQTGRVTEPFNRTVTVAVRAPTTYKKYQLLMVNAAGTAWEAPGASCMPATSVVTNGTVLTAEVCRFGPMALAEERVLTATRTHGRDTGAASAAGPASMLVVLVAVLAALLV
eukprot:TRINITY_DN602_c0_g1_i1.p1 TRINITY_DN602_c0_g1~~TRINITY_DN602_c0_g1_i1.p1  ORF type:complete len:895 (-),score=176.05 TRINITY_DN602_c0_g1_i1:69-2720(-)